MEAQLFEPLNDLTELCIGELARDRRSDHGVDLVFCVILALLDDVDNIENIGFISYCAERALVNAGAAGNALVIIYLSRLVLVH